MPTVPNMLSALRLGLAPVLLLIAWLGHPGLFLSLLLLAVFTDAIDGFIARHFNQVSRLGPKLDSLADGSIYLMLPLAVWWLWPDIIIREWPYFSLLLASIVIPAAIGIARFGALPTYHTWLVKVAVVMTWIATLQMLFGGPGWPFRITVVLSAFAAIELIVITLVLEKPRSDITTVLQILTERRSSG